MIKMIKSLVVASLLVSSLSAQSLVDKLFNKDQVYAGVALGTGVGVKVGKELNSIFDNLGVEVGVNSTAAMDVVAVYRIDLSELVTPKLDLTVGLGLGASFASGINFNLANRVYLGYEVIENGKVTLGSDASVYGIGFQYNF